LILRDPVFRSQPQYLKNGDVKTLESHQTPFIYRLNFVLFGTTLFFLVLAHAASPLWDGFADPFDYLHQSKLPLLSKSF